MGPDLYTELSRLTSEGVPFVVATVVEVQGSTPQKPGSKLVVLEDGTVLGTVGGGAIEQQIVEAARALFTGADTTRFVDTHLTHDLGMCCGGRMRVFLERHGMAAELVVFGAGHVGGTLASLALRAGFKVTVVDERPQWLGRPELEGAHKLQGCPRDVAVSLPGGEAVYACVMTHDHALDQRVVEALLRKPLAYLGVIGSRRKAERFRQRLAQAGFPAAEVERLQSPMGLPIGAVGPFEIALSILAELVSLRRREPHRK